MPDDTPPYRLHPPESCSVPCERFFVEHRQIIEFVGFVTQLATNQDRVRAIATRALRGDDAEPSKEEIRRGGAVAALPRYRRLVLQMLVAREVESFLTYITELLVAAFRTKPEMLKSKETVQLDFVLSHDGMDELVESLTERRVDRLSFSGMRQLAKDLESDLGLRLFDREDDLDNAVRIVENRSLIVHNRGVVNSRYVRNLPSSAGQEGNPITLSFVGVMEDVMFLANHVESIDRRAVAKWRLECVSPVVAGPVTEG